MLAARENSVRVHGTLLQRIYYRYFLGPDHLMKLRICRWIRRVFKDLRVTIPYNGDGWLSVDEEDLVQRHCLVFGAYEPEVWENLASYATGREIVWDIGAHVGSFSVRAMMDKRVEVVYAFEPVPETFELLVRNVAMNRGWCVPMKAALLSRLADVQLSRGPVGNIGLASVGDTGDVRAKAVSADYLVESGLAKPPTLVKLDVEGAEMSVLEGARKLFGARPPKAVAFEAECADDLRILDGALTAFFEEFGYQVSHIARPDGHALSRENYLAVRAS